MSFRYITDVNKTNKESLEYLTRNLNNKKQGEDAFNSLLKELGNTVDSHPKWHPILTLPPNDKGDIRYIKNISEYNAADHTVEFVRGFVTCPYNKDKAEQMVSKVNAIAGLRAYLLDTALYSDHAYPVVVEALDVELEADGTIRSRDALAWCTQWLVKDAFKAQVAETWWNMKSCLLGYPHGSRSSVSINQFTGGHMRKILEALNESGIFGPIKECSLEMLPKKKRKQISNTLISAALQIFNHSGSQNFDFELRGETCEARIQDMWEDGTELSISVMIGDFDLCINGFYYPNKDLIEASEPTGKKALAEKFI